MKKIVFICLLFYLFGYATKAQINEEPVVIESLKLNSNEKQINLIFYEKNVPVQQKDIFLCFYDETTRKNVIKRNWFNSGIAARS